MPPQNAAMVLGFVAVPCPFKGADGINRQTDEALFDQRHGGLLHIDPELAFRIVPVHLQHSREGTFALRHIEQCRHIESGAALKDQLFNGVSLFLYFTETSHIQRQCRIVGNAEDFPEFPAQSLLEFFQIFRVGYHIKLVDMSKDA